MYDLSRKTALVTGASKGIGRAIALAYADKGAKVALVARSEDALKGVAEQIGDLGREALPIAADLGDEAEIRRVATAVLGRFDQVDILVNNAGIIHPKINLADCQRRSKSTPLAGVKMHHLMRFSPALAVVPVVHRRDPRCFV